MQKIEDKCVTSNCASNKKGLKHLFIFTNTSYTSKMTDQVTMFSN